LSEDFLQTIMDLQAQYHFLIVADEVQSGLYRTGIPFSYQRTPLKPDMVTVAKSLGGGLPIGALIATSEVASAFTYGDHGSTFGGNPFVAALGNALLGELSSTTFQTHLKTQCQALLQGLKEIARLYPHVITQIRGEGMMLGLEVGTYAPLIQKAAFNKKLLLNVTNQTVIRLLPPLTINQKELSEFFTKFKQSIDEVCLQ
ncbi:MAG: aminotransferase class III-fold pyridoxal phosphate-dependent enzyme, partial [Candidatus Izemoplasmatales bacterium]|nr:aminotransferase class III-fold pyridoxal phosphate-dependent enzyme [Candidatus Izemoplasmatales bacterium]